MSDIITLSRDCRVIFQFIFREFNNVVHSIASNCLFSEVSETRDSLFSDWLLNLCISEVAKLFLYSPISQAVGSHIAFMKGVIHFILNASKKSSNLSDFVVNAPWESIFAF